MTTAVQRRRGTNTEHASFTGLEGEISVNTTNESVHVHDGSTAGGFELMRADGANSTVTLGDISGVTAGTGLSGGGTTGTVTLDIDGTVATLAGTQTFTNKTLTSPILNTPTIGTSFTIGGATITEAELEILDGATVTTTELNYVDGVTSAIQTQIDAKAPLASPSFTGNVSVGGTVDGRDLAADGTKLDLINQGVATTDSPAFAGLTVDTTTLAVDSTNNRVGIGTSSPAYDLDIEAGTAQARIHSTAGNSVLRLDSVDSGESKIFFADNSASAIGTIEYHHDSNYMSFDTVATERMRIDSSGNVGIGTTSPSRTLHLKEAVPSIRLEDTDVSGVYHEIISEANTGYCIRVDEGNVSSGSYFRVDIDNSEKMRIDSSGNVGIGTDSPSNTLDVRGTMRYDGRLLTNSTTADGSAAAPSIVVGYDYDNGFFRPSSNTIGFTTGGSERMRIDSTGNVGIGTTSPSKTLVINENDSECVAIIKSSDTGTAGLFLGGQTDEIKGGIVFNNSDNSLQLRGHNNAERMRIDSSGNVAIGTSAPAARLHLSRATDGSEASPHFRIDGAASTYTANHWLDSNAYYMGQNSTFRSLRIYSGAETSGVHLASGGTSWGTFSDERLKYDVEPVENAVESLSNLRTVKYRLKDVDSAEDKKKIGLMAQDLVGVLDEVIDPVKKTGDDTEYMSVRYTELVPVLVKAIQEQQTLIESLTARIAALEE